MVVVPQHHVMSLIDECKGIFPQVTMAIYMSVCNFIIDHTIYRLYVLCHIYSIYRL